MNEKGTTMEPTLQVMVEDDQLLPAYKTDGAAGMDIRSNEDLVLFGNSILSVRTGLHLAIPKGYEGHLRSRSGLAKKYVTLFLEGTIDPDYRGEITLLMRNHRNERFEIKRFDRIAQLVISPVARCTIVKVPLLDETVRGVGGFGSTGVR